MISVLFYGTPEIARISLAALLADQRFTVRAVVTQPDRPTGRKQILTPSPVKSLALEHNLPVIQPERIKRDESGFIDAINVLGPFDIAVVVAFGQILPERVLSVPKHGSLNLHASLLPRWRGAAPIQRAIMAGDSETGVCLMQMDAGLDTGAVLAREQFKIDPADDASTLHDKIATRGAQLIVGKLEDIVAERLLPVAQPEEGVTYADKITDADCLIDWTKPAHQIANLIRGLSPRPGAFTLLAGKRVKLFSVQAIDELPAHSMPGMVLNTTSDSLSIACGSGKLVARELQLEGKTRVSVEQFLKGNVLPHGSQFTSVKVN